MGKRSIMQDFSVRPFLIFVGLQLIAFMVSVIHIVDIDAGMDYNAWYTPFCEWMMVALLLPVYILKQFIPVVELYWWLPSIVTMLILYSLLAERLWYYSRRRWYFKNTSDSK